MNFRWRRPRQVKVASGRICVDEAARATAAFLSVDLGTTGAEWLQLAMDAKDLNDLDPADQAVLLEQAITKWGFLTRAHEESVEDWQEVVGLLREVHDSWKRDIFAGEELRWGAGPDVATQARMAAQQLAQKAKTDRAIDVEVTSEPQFAVVPVDLLGFLAIQAARAVREEHSFRKCKECEQYFRITSRRKREYCSQSCRMRRANRGRPGPGSTAGRGKGRGKKG